MTGFNITYSYAYTTSGGAHRYNPTRKSKVTIGSIYLRGVDKAPRRLKIRVEGDDVDEGGLR